MFKKILLLLLLGHIMGEYYTQPKKITEKKEKSSKWLLIHCICYFITMLIISIPVMSLDVMVMDVFVAVFHMIIDLGKLLYLKRFGDTHKERNIYLSNQLLHLCSFVGISYCMAASSISLNELKCFERFMDTIGVEEMIIVSWSTAILILHKPANTMIQKVLKEYKPQKKEIEITMQVDL